MTGFFATIHADSRPDHIRPVHLAGAFEVMDMTTDIDGLARRLALDPRINTGTLRRVLEHIDAEIHHAARIGEPVPPTIRQVRDVVAQAWLKRLERERTPAPDDQDI